MKKVLLYHKQLTSLLGGGTFQPLLLVAALQKSCEVTLALNTRTDIEAVSRMAGIEIDIANLKIEILDPEKGFSTRHPYLLSLRRQRKIKKLAKNFDICISTANVIDFGKDAHHFVYLLSSFGGHAFYDYLMPRKGRLGLKRLARKIATGVSENVVKPLLGLRPLKKILHSPGERIYSTSRYVETILHGFYGAFNGRIFYPPTLFEFDCAKAVRDPLRIIYVGRIFAPKRIVDMVEIVEKARSITGLDLEFHVAGELTNIPYVAKLKNLADHRRWLKLAGPVYGEGKEKFMLSATYALHAERDEAFGIAIAEYLKAGLVPLVPYTGGPAEIVGLPELLFRDLDEAASKLARLVEDGSERGRILGLCRERSTFFTRAAYEERERKLVDEILGCRFPEN